MVRGERRRSSLWFNLARLSLTTATILLMVSTGDALKHVPWYRYRPTEWVLRDLHSSDPAQANRAWDELRRRWDANKLSADQRRDILLACADEQAVEPPRKIADAMIDFVGDKVAVDTAGPEVVDRFFDKALRPVVALRDPIGSGDLLPCDLTLKHRYWGGAIPDESRRWWSAVAVGPVVVDGHEAEPGGGSLGSKSFQSFGRRHRLVGPFPPGHHTLTWQATWYVWFADEDPFQSQPERAKRTVTGTATFDVLPGKTLLWWRYVGADDEWGAIGVGLARLRVFT